MMKNLKKILGPIILVLVVGAFTYYLKHHPETIDQIKTLSPLNLAALILLYAIWFVALILVTRISLRMYQKNMSRQENLLFNAYSSLINFFGPGQSGPIFRAAYLKKRHQLGIKQFMFTTLLYYGFYAMISACFMFVGTRPWWQTVLFVAAVGSFSLILIRWYGTKKAKLSGESGVNAANIMLLFGATALQMIAQVGIYAVELNGTGAGASFGQILAYTGVANFAIFVALTPGAIGFREGFLLFSQGLHGISSTAIVAANLIDRAVYLLFLGLLFILVLATHAKDKLRVKDIEQTT